jgi:hypothetical protein
MLRDAARGLDLADRAGGLAVAFEHGRREVFLGAPEIVLLVRVSGDVEEHEVEIVLEGDELRRARDERAAAGVELVFGEVD